MNKIRKNAAGFSAFEAVIIILVLVVVGGAGYLVYKNQNKTKATATPVSTTNKTAKADPYADWDIYSASLEKVSFKYPKNWTVATGDDAPVKSADLEAIRLNAPARVINGVSYQYSILFRIYTPQSVGQDVIYSSKPLTDHNFSKPLYSLLLEDSASDNDSDPNNGKICAVQLSTIDSKAGAEGEDSIPTTTQGRYIDFGGSYSQAYGQNSSTVACFTSSQFPTLQEVQQTEQIFSTLSQN